MAPIEHSRWRVAAASSIGTSHRGSGTTCQDAHRVDLLPDAEGEVLVLVAADGAGSAAYAERGAAIACEALRGGINFALSTRAAESFGEPDLRSWVVGARDAIVIAADAAGASPREFACTCLVAVLSERCALFGQIGDGVIIVGDLDGWSWVHWPAHGQYINTTCFLTDLDALDQLQVAFVPGRVDEVAVLTDGLEALVLHYATRTVHGPFFDRMMPPVRHAAPGVDPRLCQGLLAYLESEAINSRTSDDKTLILASRREPQPTAP